VSKKRPPFYILNISMKNEMILIIFSGQNPEEISHHIIINTRPPHLNIVATLRCKKTTHLVLLAE